MSELGILRIKSFARDSLFMKIGGEGVETNIIENTLYIKAKNRMLGYLNAKSPFDKNFWYCTKDLVQTGDDDYLKIIGRDNEVINVVSDQWGAPTLAYDLAKAVKVSNMPKGPEKKEANKKTTKAYEKENEENKTFYKHK